MKSQATLACLLAIGVGVLCAGTSLKRAYIPDRSESKPTENVLSQSIGHKTMFSEDNRFETSLNGGKAQLSQARVLMKAPERISASGSTVYGSMIVGTGVSLPEGLARVYADGKVSSVFKIPDIGPEGQKFYANLIYERQGKFYALCTEKMLGFGVMGYYLYVYDSEGNLLENRKYEDKDIMFSVAGYDAENDMLYGYYGARGAVVYGTAKGETPYKIENARWISKAILPLALTYNQISKKLIGISDIYDGADIYEMDIATGAQTKIRKLDYPSEYITGICYSPLDQAYYYAYCGQTSSGLTLLDEDNYNTISHVVYNGAVEYSSLYCPDAFTPSANSPLEPELVNTSFKDGALSGSITYKLATSNVDGTPILGNLDWEFDVDGVEKQRGSSPAGSEITVDATGLEEGLRTFVLRTFLGSNQGRFNRTILYVGDDTPKAPESVTLSSQKVSWTPVTEGVHNGYVNASEVTYNVFLNDKLAASGIKGTEATSLLPQGEAYANYTASVEAVFKGKSSERTYSNDINYGEALTLPLNLTPTEKESRLFSIYNGNGDDKTIFYSYGNYGEGYTDVKFFMYQFSRNSSADDWLYLPIANFPDKNGIYDFSMNCFRSNSQYPEKIEVMLCSAPDGKPESIVKTILAPTVIDNPQISSTNQAEVLGKRTGASFTVPEAGNYYVGIHVISDKWMYNLMMRDFHLSRIEGATVSSPNMPTGLSATPGANGNLNAKVTFTFPTTDIAGNSYDPTKTLSATVAAEGCTPTTATGKAGEETSVTILTKQGDNKVTITPKDGELPGIPASVDVYTGVVLPVPVTNLRATTDETNYIVTLSWDKPTSGVDGGYIDPQGITYYLVEETSNGWALSDKLGKNITSVALTLKENTPQQYMRLGVLTVNFVGQAQTFATTGVIAGDPLPNPSMFDFTAGAEPNPIVKYTSNMYMEYGDPSKIFGPGISSGGERTLFTYYPSMDPTPTTFSMPKFTTENTTKPAVKLIVAANCTSSISIEAASFDIERKTVKTFSQQDIQGDGKVTLIAELGDEFKDKGWVEIFLTANASIMEGLVLYDVEFIDNIPYDFGVVDIEGDDLAKIGEVCTYKAHVYNYGTAANIVPAGEWKLSDASGNIIANVNVEASSEAVQPGTDSVYQIAFTPTADQCGELTLSYTIANSDNKDINNSFVKSIDVTKGVTPVVTDLKATSASDSEITLEWTPIESGDHYIEGFEEEKPFVLDKTSDMVAQFKRIDKDGKRVYTPSELLPNPSSPQSFVVWSTKTVNDIFGAGATNLSAKDGDKFLIAICPGERDPQTGNTYAADDWLISPELTPGTDFGFSARAIITSVGVEPVEVLYSSTGDSPEDFILLEKINIGEGQSGLTIWENYSFTLPNDAKYFAIHYVGQNRFGVIFDDILYTPLGYDIELTGYNILRDGQNIAINKACQDGKYIDSTVQADTEYTYNVMPVMSDGESGMLSNTIKVRSQAVGINGVDANGKYISGAGGVITVKGYDGHGIVIMTADGKVISAVNNAADIEHFEVLEGVYIVKAGKDSVTIIM